MQPSESEHLVGQSRVRSGSTGDFVSKSFLEGGSAFGGAVVHRVAFGERERFLDGGSHRRMREGDMKLGRVTRTADEAGRESSVKGGPKLVRLAQSSQV
jgi:hypothetical protein